MSRSKMLTHLYIKLTKICISFFYEERKEGRKEDGRKKEGRNNRFNENCEC